jgi:hypothetical protein
MEDLFKVNGDTITYNGVTYKKVEEPKEPTLRDRIADVIGSHLDMVEFAEDVDSDALAQDLMNHILEWIPDYSHNNPSILHVEVFEDFKNGWDAHAKETFKVFDWVY